MNNVKNQKELKSSPTAMKNIHLDMLHNAEKKSEI